MGGRDKKMAKDPAFLFYTSDFYMGTIELNDTQVGQYIRLMCLQHQKGHLSKAVLQSVMGAELDPAVADKFEIDEEGNYFNKRLEEETNKRKRYSESRRANRAKAEEKDKEEETQEEDALNIEVTDDMPVIEDVINICSTHVAHMVNENENEDINIINLDKTTKKTRLPKKPPKRQYGEYKNVLLTGQEIEKLKQEFPDYLQRVEKLSGYMQSTGKKYKDHLATIRNWARKDQESGGMRVIGSNGREIKPADRADKIYESDANGWG